MHVDYVLARCACLLLVAPANLLVHPTALLSCTVVVVVVFFTLTDRASTIPSNSMDANPVRGHKEVPRSTGHIMVTTRYSDQQGSKSRQKVLRLHKRWHRPITKRYIKPPLLHIAPGACHYLTNRFQMEAPVAPSRRFVR